MTRLLILTFGATLTVAGCGTSASDAVDTPLASDSAAEAPGRAAAEAQPRRAANRNVVIPDGTSLPLSLTTAVASDTSAVEDRVTAELTRVITVDGRSVLPVGTRFTGIVTSVDDSDRIKGRANIAFRFTSLSVGGTTYDIATALVSRVASATKGEDATKIGIGAGAGAIIGGLLGGRDGAAKGAAVGGGAGTGVVLATKGKEIRLGLGADVTTQLTSSLTMRVRAS